MTGLRGAETRPRGVLLGKTCLRFAGGGGAFSTGTGIRKFGRGQARADMTARVSCSRISRQTRALPESPCSRKALLGVIPGTIPGTSATVLPEHFRQVLRRALFPVLPGSTRTAISAPNPAVALHASLRAARDLDAGSAGTATIEVKTWPMPAPSPKPGRGRQPRSAQAQAQAEASARIRTICVIYVICGFLKDSSTPLRSGRNDITLGVLIRPLPFLLSPSPPDVHGFGGPFLPAGRC